MNNRCCEALSFLLENPDAPIEYFPEIRSYHLVIPDQFLTPNEIAISFKITHCPRCGSPFPASLADERDEILAAEYDITDTYNEEQKKRIPSEFSTDAWWKKRNL